MAQRAAAGRLLQRPRRCSRRCSRSPGVDWRAEPEAARRSCTRAASASVIAGERDDRLARRAAPAGRGASGTWPGRRPRFELDVDALVELAAGRQQALPRRDELPGRAAGHRGGGGRGRDAPPRSIEAVRAGGGDAARRRSSCSTSTAASRSARARSRSPCGSPSRRPTARSPTRRWPSGAHAIEAALARAGRAAACLSTALPWWAPAASAARCARTSSTTTRRWS